MLFKDGVFIITEETNCPLYHVTEELHINEGILALPAGKPTCLTLINGLINITSSEGSYERYRHGTNEKAKFECGGCSGIIRFEYKKARGFATLQMKLLEAAKRREKIEGVSEFADLLRSIDIFSTLSDEDLLDLATLLELKDYPWQLPITQKGDIGNRLFIIISGKAEVIDDQGATLAVLGQSEVFGEMSLLSGEPVTATIMAAEPCKIAIMSRKNFKHIITRFSALQVFFYKLVVRRITQMNQQRANELSSGMVGQLSDISTVELCQMINANQKTGRLTLEYEEKKAVIVFNEGELVHAEFNKLEGKDAFYEILIVEDGRFRFSQGLDVKEKKLDVLGGFMGLLMEGMQRLDDKR
jgi:CRP-like cAMP-binding protein